MNPVRILLTRPLPEEPLESLRQAATLEVLSGTDDRPIPSEAELIDAVRSADPEILFTLPAHPVTSQVIAAGNRLRLIATMGTGFDNIDVGAAKARGIVVSNAPGVLDETVADLTFGLLLATARRIPEAERFLRDGKYLGWTPFLFAGADVHGRTLGIVGLGKIGRAVARRARGFGMRTLYTSRGPVDASVEADLGCQRVALSQLLAESDFVSLHVPLTEETRHLIDARALAAMKRTSVLINTSRGPVVDEAALAEALRQGTIAGAGIDVFEREPAVHPDLLAAPNAVLLPHIGSASAETRRRMAARAVENILAFLQRGEVLDRVA